jgi:ferrochelatase
MTGLLLCNLGTPEKPDPGEVRRYLRQFLSDPRVLDIGPVGRWALLNLIILPLRARKSALAYQKIWSERGSPLLWHSQDLVVSSTGSTVAEVLRIAARPWSPPSLRFVEAFHDDAGFIDAFAAVGGPIVESERPDHVLMSFHGLPERHMRKTDATGKHCLARADCCDRIGPENRSCYRAQCYATARALASRLDLAESTWSVSFQSRLGRTPWIHPYTDVVIPRLAAEGKKRLVVFSPAFVADCLETLEEIGIRAKLQFEAAGGERLTLVPSLNATPTWVDTVVALARRQVAGDIAAGSLR